MILHGDPLIRMSYSGGEKQIMQFWMELKAMKALMVRKIDQ